MSQKKSMNLGVKILIGLVLGIVVGAIFWATMGAEAAGAFTAKYIKPFGDIFVNLLKFIVVPLVLLSIMDGVIQMGDINRPDHRKPLQGQLPDAAAGRGRRV